MPLELPDGRSFSLHPRVRFRAVGEEGVIISLANEQVMSVNAVGLRIVEQLSASGTAADLEALVSAIVEEFEVAESDVRRDITRFLHQLEEAQLLVVQE